MRFIEANEMQMWANAAIAALGKTGTAGEAIAAADDLVEAFRERVPPLEERTGSGLVVPTRVPPNGGRFA